MIRLRKTNILLLLMLLVLPATMRAQEAFYIEALNITSGDTKTLCLSLDNSSLYKGFQTDLVLPEGLSVVTKTNGAFDISLTDRASSSFSLSSNEISERTIRMVCFSSQNETFSGNSGRLVKVQIKASSDFAGGAIQLRNSIFSDTNDKDVKMDDSKVQVLSQEQNSLSITDGELAAGKGLSFSLSLNNDVAFTAYQLDVVLPTGLTLDLSKCGMTERCSSSHKLTTKDLGNGKYRFICMSMDNATFSGNQGAILNLWIQSENGANGKKTVNINNVVFSDAKAKSYPLDAVSFQLDIKFIPVSSISISETSASLNVGDTHQLLATVLPDNCSDKTLVWESSNSAVATVDNSGNITAITSGQCSIIAYSADRSVKATCNVTVKKIALTAQVQDATRTYGDANPEFKISYSGFKEGDSEAGFSVLPTIVTTADVSSNIGTYTITASGAVSDKYEITYVAGALTVTKAALTVSAGNYTKKQGDAMPEFKATYSGFKNDETEEVLIKKPVLSTDVTVASAPGEYAVTVSGAEAENYEISYVSGTLTVVQADAVIIRAKSYTRTYGDANPTFEYDVEGATLDGTPEITCVANARSSVGTYTIEVKQGTVKNYNVSFVSGTLTVTKAPLTISAGNYTKKQGDAMPEFKASYSGLKNDETEEVLTKKPVLSTDATVASAPGEYAVTVSGAEAENYEISYVSGTLTVIQADAVIIRAKSYTRTYGDANPTFEYDVEGATLDGTPEITCVADNKSSVGTYTIEVKQGTVKNYNVSFVSGTLTVTKAALTVSAGNYTKKQGDAMPEFKASYSGFKNDETEDVLAKKPVFSTDATVASAPGEYSVTVSGAEAENYEMSYEPGTLTVVQADAVIVRAKSYTRTYGDTNPTFEFETEGATLDGTPEITCVADNKSSVGTYAIEVKQGTVKNYNVSFVSGTLTVTKASLTVSAGNYTKKQGDAMPEFTANYSGFKNDETETVLSKKPVLSTDATVASAPGEYDVTAGGAEAENYDISYVPGTLTVVQADAVIIRAKSYTRAYGDANPTFEYEVEGATLDGTPEITCVADNKSSVGTYAIEVKQGTVKNYNVSFVSGTLTVTKAALTVSAGNYTKKQGDVMPEFAASYSGFKNDETEEVLSKKPVLSTDATVASAPGEYAVTVSGAEAENYDINYEQGTLTVVQADAVIIRAKSYTRTYGDANPTFEFEVEGATLDGTPEITCVADNKSSVGTYTIEVKQGTVKNYNVSFVSGTLTVTKAALTISAGNYTKKQGDAMPEFKAAYSGFKNNETEDVLIKKPVFSTDATVASAPSEYRVTVSGAEAENYEISYKQGTLTVVQADAVIVRAKSYTRIYGEANPIFEYEVEGATLDGTPEITCVADKSSAVGTYTIEVKQGTVKNYNVSFVSGTLTVTKAALTVSAGNYTKKQGDAMPEFKAIYSGFKNDDTETVLSKKPVFSTDATVASAPGEYAVIVSGAEAENYEISYVFGTLTVVQADAVIVRAKSYTRTYGDDNPTFEFETEGATLDGTPEITCVADNKSSVGTYAIEVKQGTVKNNNVSFVSGTLTVTKAALTVSAGNYTKKQGDAMPEFKASYSGFKNDETEDVLAKKPVFSTDATVASAPGEYSVTVSGAEAENYEISYVQGILRIFDSKQTITWDKDIEPRIGATYTMNATASSGLPVTYSYIRPMSAWQAPSINENEVTFPTGGSYIIIATQSGNEEYDAVSDTLEVCALENDEELMYIDGIYYKYADKEHTALKVVRGYKTYSGEVIIPETVNGLPVVEIDRNALYACYFLNSVIVGDNVVGFGHECLGADPNLLHVTLPYNATSLQDYMFNCDDKLAEIHCRATNPYDANEKIFNGFIDYDACVLYVPRGTKDAYAAHELWGKFVNIVEEDVETGIEHVLDSTENIATGWYTISGVKLSEKPKLSGVYIHDGKKVYVK